MKCPKCSQEGAKESSYYPGLLVHKCDGIKLEEVGKIDESNQIDLNVDMFSGKKTEHQDWL